MTDWRVLDITLDSVNYSEFQLGSGTLHSKNLPKVCQSDIPTFNNFNAPLSPINVTIYIRSDGNDDAI